jgi:Dullard-like phosphatase family protein
LVNNQNNNIININVNKQNILNNDDSFINFYLPNKLKENINKKTLLIDLDETLVHSSFRPLPINADINFNIFYQNKPHMINVLIRPYVQEFLKKMSNLYEIIIFTASVPQYANPLLDKLDKNKYIHHRLYRQHCISLYGLFIKDLRRIGRDLKNTILLDNNPISYLLNQENGLPIKTWHSDKKDQELIKIIPLLEYLAKIEINDVRQVIRKIIVNNAIDYNLVKDLISKNNNNNMMNYNSNQKIMVRSNSFSNLKRNDVVNGNKYLTPKKDMKNNILINNYYRKESNNKKDDKNNININIINFNISKVYMNDEIKKHNNNSNKIKNNIPISKKSKKTKNQIKVENMRKINNIFDKNSKNKKSKEDLESLINSKYKYLGHLINNKKQHKNNSKIINKDIDINNSLLKYKRQFSQKYILSTTSKNTINVNYNENNDNFMPNPNSIKKELNHSFSKRTENKNYNNTAYNYHNNHHNAKNNLSIMPNTNNAIINNNKVIVNYVYNNFINDNNNKKGNIEYNNKMNFDNLLKYYSSFNEINNNEKKIINNNKIHQRASTPSTINHFYQKSNRDFYKEYPNYNDIKYEYNKYN